MKRRTFLASSLAAGCLLSGITARSAAKVYSIGWITAQRAASLAPYLDAFRAGLAAIGYVEGRNLVIDYRYADDAIDRVPNSPRSWCAFRSMCLSPRAPRPSRFMI